MAAKPIRVGIIGLNPGIHWAATAHMPALAALADSFEVVGVANSSAESSLHAAQAFGLRHAFDSPAALAASPDVDLVVITVKVPHHFALVKAALDAGKHVFCEWPLGNGLEEARQLADMADTRGVVAAVGTQMSTAVELEYLRELIADGYVGEVLSTTLVGSGNSWGDETDTAHAYLYEKANGATLLSIPMGHTLAGLRDVLGEVGDISARMIGRRKTVHIADTGETRSRDVEDNILVHGTLASGAAIAIHYRGGSSRGVNLLWEINGTEGDIQVTGASGHGQMAELTIRGGRGIERELADLMPPAAAYAGWPDASIARNVARLYARIADDIRTGTRTAPSFRDAVALHEVIDRIERSAV